MQQHNSLEEARPSEEMVKHLPFKSRRLVLVLLVPAALIAIYILHTVAVNNLVWLAVAWRATGEDFVDISNSPMIVSVGNNARTNMALGVLAAFSGDEATAQALWQRGRHIDQLMVLGQQAQAQGSLDLAMAFYRGAGDTPEEQGWYGIGKVCQGTWAHLHKLSSENQQRCRHMFEQYGLLLNGDFSTGDLAGWTQLGKNSAQIINAELSGTAARIIGNDSSHMLYQWINIVPGTTVKFSAYVRVQDPIPQKLRLLYIGFKGTDGSSVGNAMAAVDANLIPQEWIYVERSYTLPAAQNNRYLFAPAEIRGAGQVEVDRVQLIIVEQP